MAEEQLLHGVGLDAVIGMYPVVHRLRSTVVTPVVAASLGDPAVSAPGSLLLYGPPRCGATFIAERLGGEIEALSGRRVVALGRIDASSDPETIATVLGDARAAGDLVVATTWEPWDLPAGVIGSFDRFCFVHPPDWDARRFRLWESVSGRISGEDELAALLIATEGWCGVDLAEAFTRDRPAQPGDLGPTTAAWFDAAQRWASDGGRAGLDDLVAYLSRLRRW